MFLLKKRTKKIQLLNGNLTEQDSKKHSALDRKKHHLLLRKHSKTQQKTFLIQTTSQDTFQQKNKTDIRAWNFHRVRSRPLFLLANRASKHPVGDLSMDGGKPKTGQWEQFQRTTQVKTKHLPISTSKW